jgi:hypothetical protein
MLVAINVHEQDGTKAIHKVNPFHIVRMCMYNPKNSDEGTLIYMKNGDEIYTPDPLDIVDINIISVSDRFAAAIMVQVAAQYARLIKKPVRRKTTVKK